jgi:apolipoprotein N-acyltransferase
VNRWFGAAIFIAVITAAILIGQPSWLLTACNDTGDCGVVSGFLVGFVGALLAVGCMLLGVLSRSR